MQTKAIIIILALFIGALVVFNAITSTQHRTDLADPDAVATAQVTDSTSTATSTKIVNQPLGQQPKAVLDKATKQIEDANQVETDKMQQVDSL